MFLIPFCMQCLGFGEDGKLFALVFNPKFIKEGILPGPLAQTYS